MKNALQQAADDHTPILAECGGMMALSSQINCENTFDLLPCKSQVTSGLQGVGKQQLDLHGHKIKAHTFHYCVFETALTLLGTATAKYGNCEAV